MNIIIIIIIIIKIIIIIILVLLPIITLTIIIIKQKQKKILNGRSQSKRGDKKTHPIVLEIKQAKILKQIIMTPHP